MSTLEKISPDDPRLTAYALGEMEPTEREEFEKLLKQDAAARALVAEINGTAHNIGVALASESVAQPSAVQFGQAAIIPGRDLRKLDGGPLRAAELPEVRRGLAKLLRFPSMYFTISGLAAACFAVGFILWQASYVQQPQVHYTEVDLTKFKPMETAKAKNTAEPETDLEVGLQAALVGSDREVVSLEKTGKTDASLGLKPKIGPAKYRVPVAGMVRRAGLNQGSITETNDRITDNVFQAVKSEPLSTFPINADTAAYASVRHFIREGQRPPAEAVRIEELVNHFSYHYAPSENATVPFAAHLEVASAPWTPEHRLVRIGLKGRETQSLSAGPTEGVVRPIAKDVKILVEFNPAQVQAYRLIGYENRMLQKEPFNDDKIDAGEIGAGHTVTALYEVVPVGVKWTPESSVDGLKYQTTASPLAAGIGADVEDQKVAMSDEVLILKLRYKEPAGEVSSKLEFPLRDSGRTFDEASADFKFAASVAAFGMILRDSPHKGEATFAQVTKWAQAGLVNDAGGHRTEFVGLVGLAGRLTQN